MARVRWSACVAIGAALVAGTPGTAFAGTGLPADLAPELKPAGKVFTFTSPRTYRLWLTKRGQICYRIKVGTCFDTAPGWTWGPRGKHGGAAGVFRVGGKDVLVGSLRSKVGSGAVLVGKKAVKIRIHRASGTKRFWSAPVTGRVNLAKAKLRLKGVKGRTLETIGLNTLDRYTSPTVQTSSVPFFDYTSGGEEGRARLAIDGSLIQLTTVSESQEGTSERLYSGEAITAATAFMPRFWWWGVADERVASAEIVLNDGRRFPVVLKPVGRLQGYYVHLPEERGLRTPDKGDKVIAYDNTGKLLDTVELDDESFRRR
ncbi:hypothetical protein EDD29_5425 [Actinocorallia herbida]|uniref:Uncharacterized protein n=1 Tax=Actinocorallia herbida TaxID=58109 RepID=A0A3N1D2T2_9ACTN|nr:hypothetical protein EDD29_5425 [Actinocorallia herbida]